MQPSAPRPQNNLEKGLPKQHPGPKGTPERTPKSKIMPKRNPEGTSRDKGLETEDPTPHGSIDTEVATFTFQSKTEECGGTRAALAIRRTLFYSVARRMKQIIRNCPSSFQLEIGKETRGAHSANRYATRDLSQHTVRIRKDVFKTRSAALMP